MYGLAVGTKAKEGQVEAARWAQAERSWPVGLPGVFYPLTNGFSLFSVEGGVVDRGPR